MKRLLVLLVVLAAAGCATTAVRQGPEPENLRVDSSVERIEVFNGGPSA
jgi:hypothetical protein